MKLMLRIEYLGIPFLSITWLGMAWAYFDPKGLPKRYRLGLLLPCLATLVVIRKELGTRSMWAIMGLSLVIATVTALLARGVSSLIF